MIITRLNKQIATVPEVSISSLVSVEIVQKLSASGNTSTRIRFFWKIMEVIPNRTISLFKGI